MSKTSQFSVGPAVKGYAVLYHTLPKRRDIHGLWPKIEFAVVFVRVTGADEDPISEAQKVIGPWNVYIDKVIDKVVQLETANGDVFGNIFKYGKMTRDRWPARAVLPGLRTT